MIYTPTDNEQVPMRPLMTKEQAEGLIGRMSELEPLEIPTEKMRRDLYRQAMHSCDPEQYVRLIKTVYHRRMDMMQQHKRLSETDSDFERNAKLSLYHELSVVLDVQYSEVEKYLVERLQTA